MTDDDDRIDFSALDPGADPTRPGRSARAIATRVAPSLRRRRERAPFVWLQLVQWRRPVLAAAAVVAVASVTVLALPRPRAVIVGADGTAALVTSPAPLTIAEAAGVPAPVAIWVEGGTPPADEDLPESPPDAQETP